MINPCMSPKSTNFKLGHVMERTNFGGKIGTILVILALQEDNFHLLRTPSPTTFSVRHQTQRFCYAQLFLLRTTFFCYAQLFLLRTTFSVTHNFFCYAQLFLLRTPLRTTFSVTHNFFLLRTTFSVTHTVTHNFFSVTHTVMHNFFSVTHTVTHNFFCYAHRYAQLFLLRTTFFLLRTPLRTTFFCYAHRYAQLFLLRTPLRTTFIDLVFGYACYACYACYSNYNWPAFISAYILPVVKWCASSSNTQMSGYMPQLQQQLPHNHMLFQLYQKLLTLYLNFPRVYGKLNLVHQYQQSQQKLLRVIKLQHQIKHFLYLVCLLSQQLLILI